MRWFWWVAVGAVLAIGVSGDLLSADSWRPVPAVGLQAKWQRTPQGWRCAFVKTSEERRLLALEATVKGLDKFPSLILHHRLRLVKGQSPRLVIIAFGKGNAAWFRLGSPLSPTDEVTEQQLPLTRLTPTAYQPVAATFSPSQVQRLQVGLVLDGVAEGVWEVRRIALSTEPFKPTQPFVIPLSPESRLSLAHHPLAKVTTTIVKQEKVGWCWRTEFVLVGGQHMWVLPSIVVPNGDLTGYRGLQLTYRTHLPANIKALLVTLVEQDGSHYYNDGLATPTTEWRTLLLPFSEFRLGGWSQDENGQLDLDQISSVIVGMHGTTTETEGRGWIEVANLTFVP